MWHVSLHITCLFGLDCQEQTTPTYISLTDTDGTVTGLSFTDKAPSEQEYMRPFYIHICI